ncbi:hypothetical protein TSAR_013202 [Trichomalopsis sarcophagae]|uniref:Replication protein A OB domain-containing protein n=1 Tax=Trichomalopsis sarcophagae TaxID=543379 RepID=A0A232EDC8_9HYME|nr:hypothetical protein TSAR_013202 [Trichomalopsis sarcophagae]
MKRTLNRTINIKDITPHNPNWEICAKVTNKSEPRIYVQNKETKKNFSINLMDESGQIKCTFFDKQFEQYYENIEIYKTYILSDCYVKKANTKFNNLEHPYELNASNKTNIIKCDDTATKTLKIDYNFIKIAEVLDKEENSIIDMIAIIKSMSEPHNLINQKTGKEYVKIDVELIDDSNQSIILHYWGNISANLEENTIVAFKRIRISEYEGIKRVNITNSTIIDSEINEEEKERLSKWIKDVEIVE